MDLRLTTVGRGDMIRFKKIKVTAFVGLLDMLEVEHTIAARELGRAYEILTAKLQEAAERSAQEETKTTSQKTEKEETSTLEKVANNTIVKSMMRTAGTTIVRSLLGALGLGGRSKSSKSKGWFG